MGMDPADVRSLTSDAKLETCELRLTELAEHRALAALQQQALNRTALHELQDLAVYPDCNGCNSDGPCDEFAKISSSLHLLSQRRRSRRQRRLAFSASKADSDAVQDECHETARRLLQEKVSA